LNQIVPFRRAGVMKKTLGLVAGILLISVFPLMAGFEDVASDEPTPTPPPKTVKTQKTTTPPTTTTPQTKTTTPTTTTPQTKTTTPPPPVTTTAVKKQTNVAPTPPPPPPPPPLDVNTLKFSKEISGFGYKSWDANLPAVQQNTKVILDAVIPLIKKIPDSYKIQVIGYADGIGPEDPTGDKPGNLTISHDRAQGIVDYITRNYGISADRFTITGKGSSDLKYPSSPSSAGNRRVVIKFEP
jgi:outer membrane protein OmpA-like peptidoglycan-associated protein